METSVNHSMCRCCASEGAFKDVKSTYHWMGEEEIYADMLRECFDINLNTSEDCDESGICEVCITQLRNAINFKKQVLHTEEHYKKLVQNKALFRTNIVKIEANADDDSEGNVSADDAFSGAEFDVPIKTEEEEQKPKKRAATTKTMTTRSKKAKTESGETSTKRNEEKPIATNSKETKQTSKPNEKDKKEARIKIIKEIVNNKSNVREILMSTNATPFLGGGYTGYKCCYCDTQFPNPANLKTHSQELHGDRVDPAPTHMMRYKDKYRVLLDITHLKCKLCNTEIKSLDNLLDHLKDEHNKFVHKDIKNRILPFKFDTEVLHCAICPAVFDKFKTLLQHMNNHYGNHICEECGQGFVTNKSLKVHLDIHKLGVFKCNFCENTYETHVKRKAHEKIVHIKNNSRSKCRICNEAFKSYVKRNEHLSKVHGVRFSEIKCKACDKTFSSNFSLTVHTRRNHLMERRNKCSQCDMAFYTNAELKLHEVKHTGLKEFKCNICLKTYSRQKSLTEHMKIHNNDRRFKCEHCGQTFVQKCSWRGHLKHRHGKTV
ncbi:zinc finger protein 184-like isoform X3 [Trichoplusia ni]|uniref:Zinc finger protein 184-like isoform X3 n=1 Tax=Trichoplusia ni TaxID=7111 RepID=A0A7E5WT16_TRINI|nr:zinc finger protein 184-like isoform X3 [Trichoplusia ni]